MIWLALLLLLWTVPVWAATYYVNANGGNNGNSCLAAQNENTPKATIGSGQGCLSGGDTLIIKDGVYGDCILNPPSGSAGAPTTIKSQNLLGAILRPSCSVGGGGAMVQIGIDSERHYITIDGIVVDGVNHAAPAICFGIRSPSGDDSTTTSNITVQNTECKNLQGRNPGDPDNSNGFSIAAGTTNLTIRNNFVHDIGLNQPTNDIWPSYCMYLSARNSLIENNEFARCSGWGIHGFHNQQQGSSVGGSNVMRNNYVHDVGAQGILSCQPNVQIYNNIVEGAGNRPGTGRPGDGMAIGGSCSGQHADNSVVYNNDIVGGNTSCMTLTDTVNVQVRNNICWQNGSGDTISLSGASGTTGSTNRCGGAGTSGLCTSTGNPLFANTAFAAPADFQLQSGSPARNAGTNISLSGFTTDFGGAARQQEGTQDIGAWEFGTGPSCPVGCTCLITPGVCDAAPSNEPVAWWKFDDATNPTADSSGNNHPLTLTTTPSPTFQAGKVGAKSLGCGGNAGIATTPGAFAGSTYTWMVWLNVPVAPSTTSTSQPIRNGLNNDSWGFSWSHVFAPAMQAAYHLTGTGSYVNAQLTSTLVADRWYHVAAVYDGATLKIYLNKVLEGTTAVTSLGTPSGDFQVCGFGGFSEFLGQMDHLKIWNRALSASEIAAEYYTTQKTPKHRIVIR